MSAYELGKAAGAPVSTVYRLADDLVEREMLTRRDGGMLWLGPRLMRYGLRYRDETGACAATISIVLAERQAEERSEELARAVRNSALRIEKATGCDFEATADSA